MDVPGNPPGEVLLRLWNAQNGAALTLNAAWPARSGLIIGPDGERLAKNQALAIDELRGWRAIAPRAGDIQFTLVGEDLRVALPTIGEVPLVAYLPLIRALLAQGGPDGQVNVRLIVGGAEGSRLEVRRYRDTVEILDDRAHFGIRRDAPRLRNTAFAAALAGSPGCVHLEAMALNDPERQIQSDVDVEASLDLGSVLSKEDGPWLIHARLDGHGQRAFVWPGTATTRNERIESYAKSWRHRLEDPECSEWESDWALIRTVAEMGDAGTLDQVQALAKIPSAAVALLLRVPLEEKQSVLELDLAAPIFWPTILVEDFGRAIALERVRLERRYGLVFDPTQAADVALQGLATSIGEILRLRPVLRGHFAAALCANGLQPFAFQGGAPVPLRVGRKGSDLLFAAANDAATRFDRLPSGVKGLVPVARPSGMILGQDVQAVIDAPLVAAEVALGRRAPLDTRQILNMINFRLVDPVYFDTALPLAIEIGAP